jgi:hypothetical protein
MNYKSKHVLEWPEDSSKLSQKQRFTTASPNTLYVTDNNHNISTSPSDKITLNVGGTRFVTTLATLSWQQEWVLGSCHVKQSAPSIELFFDADPDVFAWILRQFRCKQRLPFPVHDTTPNNFIRQQLDFWGLVTWWGNKPPPVSVLDNNGIVVPMIFKSDSTLLEEAVQFFLAGHALDFALWHSLEPGNIRDEFFELLFMGSSDIEELLGPALSRVFGNNDRKYAKIETDRDVVWFGGWVGMWLPTMTLEAMWRHQDVNNFIDELRNSNHTNLTELMEYHHCDTAKELLSTLEQSTQDNTDADADINVAKAIIKEDLKKFQCTKPEWKKLHEHAKSVYVVMQNPNHVANLRVALKIHGLGLTLSKGVPNAIFRVHVPQSFVGDSDYRVDNDYSLVANSKYNISTQRVYANQRP